ncbi:hypothetical protein MAR_030560 [Mya arenaria]|uniref:Uncharacterized protein n=1 Tax=Mya arenaria TaxID=6604 RepID=A0ABY7F589_MYAAR|nr:hypothetical protein MAR_030560 [Mya arenaria]
MFFYMFCKVQQMDAKDKLVAVLDVYLIIMGQRVKTSALKIVQIPQQNQNVTQRESALADVLMGLLAIRVQLKAVANKLKKLTLVL